MDFDHTIIHIYVIKKLYLFQQIECGMRASCRMQTSKAKLRNLSIC